MPDSAFHRANKREIDADIFYAYAVRSGQAILPNFPTGHWSRGALLEVNRAERKFDGGGLKLV
jgi:hypothetical protein